MFLKQGLKWIILKEKSQRNFGIKKKRKIYVCPKCDKNSFVYVLCPWSEQLYFKQARNPGTSFLHATVLPHAEMRTDELG